MGVAQYRGALNCLRPEKDEVWCEALAFFNLMIARCPTNKHKSQFLARLENMGMNSDLRALAKSKNPKVLR